MGICMSVAMDSDSSEDMQQELQVPMRLAIRTYASQHWDDWNKQYYYGGAMGVFVSGNNITALYFPTILTAMAAMEAKTHYIILELPVQKK